MQRRREVQLSGGSIRQQEHGDVGELLGIVRAGLLLRRCIDDTAGC